MIVDTTVLLSFFNRKEPAHAAVSVMIDTADEALVVSPYVLAELDYFLLTRSGVQRELVALRELLQPAWEIAKVTDAHLAQAADLIEKYADEKIGLTDAVNIVLASEYRTRRIATLDHRHFRVLRLLDGNPVEILPRQ